MSAIQTLNQMMAEVSQAWDEVGTLRLLVSLVVPLVAWVVRKPLANLILKLVRPITKAIGFELGDPVEASVLPSIQVVIVTMGALIAHESIRLPEPYFGVVEKVLISICVAAAFAALYSLCSFIPRFFEKKHSDRAPDQISWVVRIAQFIVLFIGVSAVFRVWGIDIGPVLTGMGLAGAAVALAAQDYLKNLLAGFNNAAERRFSEGDWIRVDGLIEGSVESVDLRSTTIRRFDKAPVYVPNSELANNVLINFSRCPHRRIYWKISLTYSTPIDSLRTIRDRIEQYIDGDDRYVSPEQAARYVRIDSFDDSSIDMLVVCFSQSSIWADYLVAKEELALAIKRIVAEAGGGFAFPSRSIYTEVEPENSQSRQGNEEHHLHQAANRPGASSRVKGRTESSDADATSDLSGDD